MILVSLLMVLITIAGCTATDPPSTVTTGDTKGLPNATVDSALVFGQMHVKMLEGTNEVFEYIISGDTGDKTEFLLYMVEAGVMDDKIRAVIGGSGQSDRQIIKEYNVVENSRTALIVSALAVIEEYETNGNVSASSLQVFEDDVDLMKSTFDEYAYARYAALPEESKDLSGNAIAAISLLKMREELLEPVGESLEYVTQGNVEEKEEFYAGMDRFMAEAVSGNDECRCGIPFGGGYPFLRL